MAEPHGSGLLVPVGVRFTSLLQSCKDDGAVRCLSGMQLVLGL